MRSFVSNQHAERAVDRILRPLGLGGKRNFILLPCAKIENAVAVTYDDGYRYIVYDNAFMERIDRGSNTDWASVSILAHEIGHHLKGHTTLLVSDPMTRAELQQSRENELEADEFSGFVMLKLGASLAQAQAAMMILPDVPNPEENHDHPKRWRRLEAIKNGYNDAKTQQPLGNIDTRPSAETFFLEGSVSFILNNYPDAIEKLTVAIGLNPDFGGAYDFRGQAKAKIGEYREAIRDYDQAIKLNGDKDGTTNNNRGSAKLSLGDKDGACEDFLVSAALGNSAGDKNLGRFCQKWIETFGGSIRP